MVMQFDDAVKKKMRHVSVACSQEEDWRVEEAIHDDESKVIRKTLQKCSSLIRS
jgi:predicted transcriptional regulator